MHNKLPVSGVDWQEAIDKTISILQNIASAAERVATALEKLQEYERQKLL